VREHAEFGAGIGIALDSEAPMTVTENRLHQLFLLNLVLQLFDGIATWQGHWLWGEGNPVLHVLMEWLGVGLTLVLFKAKACAFLVVLRRCWRYREAYDALFVLAVCYGSFSFVPWMVRFMSLIRV
jgi:hypothetical protein